MKEDAKGEAKEKDKRKKKDSPRPGQESESGTAVDVNTPIGKEEVGFLHSSELDPIA